MLSLPSFSNSRFLGVLRKIRLGFEIGLDLQVVSPEYDLSAHLNDSKINIEHLEWELVQVTDKFK